MYTGFIQELGVVEEQGAAGIAIRAPKTAAGLELGGSVNVSGVCVSAEEIDGGVFRARLSAETRNRSMLGEVGAGTRVNLELPLRAGEPLHGHLVQGHVDAVGKVTRIDDELGGRRVWIRPPDRFLESLEPKGSVAVDGVSLTVAALQRDRFAVALIPSTLVSTTLGSVDVGARVNLESDLLGKLVARALRRAPRVLSDTLEGLAWAGEMRGALGVEKVVRQIASGRPVIVWDPTREAEGDVICAGATLSPEIYAFVLTQACGHPCHPCDRARLDRLEIPPMPGAGDRQGTAFHATIDLASTTGTGVSAAERAATVRRLAHPDARPSDFTSPGHVFPLAARRGGLRERAGHTEVTVALLEAAGLPTVGLCCEIMSRDGTMAGPAELERLALEWGLPLVDIAELVARL
jgi:3,4-dihydroxy 2-butanone 4-phosphate synthase/3,4-dihydroxy 2-butanone 4-phosphate synthase/GTP cyclohydrolase II